MLHTVKLWGFQFNFNSSKMPTITILCVKKSASKQTNPIYIYKTQIYIYMVYVFKCVNISSGMTMISASEMNQI